MCVSKKGLAYSRLKYFTLVLLFSKHIQHLLKTLSTMTNTGFPNYYIVNVFISEQA